MQVGWIDFSPEDRSRTLKVLEALNEPGSVDELGIGIVRDAVADSLFPGTSTLLTKARYFFLVPYLSRFLEEEHDSQRQDPRALRDRFRNLERTCAEGLLARSESKEGIVGRVSLSQGKWVTRGPGELYWAPLRSLGFMRQGAPDSYFSQFSYLADVRLRERDARYEKKKEENEDGLSDDLQVLGSMWRLPRNCYQQWRGDWNDWKERASIDLTRDEARHLRKQIIVSHPDTLFSLILRDEMLRKLAVGTLYGQREEEDGGLGDSSFHFFLSEGGLARIWQLAPDIAHLCELADDFSELVLGCRIAYNMQLAGLEELGELEWEAFEERAADVALQVNLPEIGRVLGLQEHMGFQKMSAFLDRACHHMASGNLEGLKEEIRRRERDIKGTRYKIGHPELGDFAWRGGMRLPYRFAYATSIIREIEEAGGCDA